MSASEIVSTKWRKYVCVGKGIPLSSVCRRQKEHVRSAQIASTVPP